jgi:hypothetical protein
MSLLALSSAAFAGNGATEASPWVAIVLISFYLIVLFGLWMASESMRYGKMMRTNKRSYERKP